MTSTTPTGTTHNPTPASSTGAAGLPGPDDNRAAYDPAVSGFNSSTGSGYAPSTANKEYAAAGPSQAAAKGERVGKGVKSAIAGVHGAGESLRGALNAAVDKAFGHEAGAARNEAIASRGEQEIRSGTLSKEIHD